MHFRLTFLLFRFSPFAFTFPEIVDPPLDWLNQMMDQKHCNYGNAVWSESRLLSVVTFQG